MEESAVSNRDFKLFTGPMFAGKTGSVITQAQQHQHFGRSIVYFRPRKANRGDENCVISHGQLVLEGVTPTIVEEGIDQTLFIEYVGRSHEVVIVEECHFLPRELYRTLRELHRTGRHIIVSGCDTDFNGVPFETVALIMCMPEVSTYRLTAICAACGDSAGWSQKLEAGKPAPVTSDRLETGGEEKYRALCTKCFSGTNGNAIPS